MGDYYTDDDMEDVEPIVEAELVFLGALETLDVRRIMNCWSESDLSSMIFPGTEMARGVRGVRAAWESVAENTTKLKTVLKPIMVSRLGDIGWTFLGGTLVSTHGDETLSVEVYITNIYKREGEGWKLVHHHATPGPHQPSFLEQRMN
jgi:ketosteroid isomerase-like protein